MRKQMFYRVFHSQAKTVTFAAVLLATSALASRLLGLWRDRLLAGRFGAGQDLDVYFAAFRIPDFVYGILIMGGVSVIFLPVLAEYFKKDENEGWRLANVVLNCFLAMLIVLGGILAILTPWLIKFIVPGFNPAQKDLAISVTRIMFLSPVFLGISAIFSGILHYFDRFLAYSIAPVLYNLGIIFGIFFLVPIFGVMGLAYGVIMGTVLHLLIQIPAAASSGFRYAPIFNFRYPGLLKIFKFMTWRVIGASVYQINLLVITAIASTIATGSIAIFNFANNLFNLPIGIIGASFAMASFPALSRAWADGARGEFLKNFSSSFRQILFLAVPISLLMFLLRMPTIQLIFGGGQFGAREIGLTSASLGLLSLAIFAFALTPLLLRAFFSVHDVATPTVIGLVYMVATIATSFLFVWIMGFPNTLQKFIAATLGLANLGNIQIVGLSLAVSLSGIIYFFLLLLFLRKRLGRIRLREIWRSFQRIIFACFLTAAAVYFTLQIQTEPAIRLILGGSAGVAVYIAVSYFFRSPELKIYFDFYLNSAIFRKWNTRKLSIRLGRRPKR